MTFPTLQLIFGIAWALLALAALGVATKFWLQPAYTWMTPSLADNWPAQMFATVACLAAAVSWFVFVPFSAVAMTLGFVAFVAMWALTRE
ncbi:hypothetical protein KXS07_31450 [Inquilinus limosus]|uniref:hypothetical protein n=1 Tax=Inquilinus limosus TaxID=171674 RepID=UPI003F149716